MIRLLVSLSALLCVTYGGPERVIFYTVADDDPGTWSTWFNTDNPSIFDENDRGGDMETMERITAIEGRHCDWGIQCLHPAAMEIDLSENHKRTYPFATLQSVLACTNLREQVPANGFSCYNDDQLESDSWTLPKHCLRNCLRNGQMDVPREWYQTRYKINPNCNKCADFKVRFFCLDSMKDCMTREEYIQILKEQEEYEKQQEIDAQNEVNNRKPAGDASKTAAAEIDEVKPVKKELDKKIQDDTKKEDTKRTHTEEGHSKLQDDTKKEDTKRTHTEEGHSKLLSLLLKKLMEEGQ